MIINIDYTKIDDIEFATTGLKSFLDISKKECIYSAEQ